MHFVGLGHSHVVALANGAYALCAKGAQWDGAALACRFHYLYDDAIQPVLTPDGTINPALTTSLRNDAPQFLVLSIGGNEHNVLSIVQIYRKYDFILGESPDLPLDERLEIIPESAMRETLRSWMAEKTDVLVALRRSLDLPMIQVEPPPPLPRAQVLAHPGEFFKSAGQADKMSPDLLRYKVWRVHCGLLRTICEQADVAYLPTAPEAFGPGGMLADAFCGKDATHANQAYGEAMMAAALALAKTLRPAGAP